MAVPSSRDPEVLRVNLAEWLAQQVDSDVTVDEFRVPEGSGFSSETFLFNATWNGTAQPLVMRMGPVATDVPVFPSYDLSLQVNAMKLVAGNTDVPVPNVRWYEPSESPLGGEFYVMDHVEGRAASDNPPYVFGGWVADLSLAERRTLTDSIADGMAKMHAIALDVDALAFLDRPQYGATPLDQQLGYQRWYYDWARGELHYPCIEDAFDWLHANRPSADPVGLSWGDARIGNVMFDGLAPAAFVDWEMACLGAPATDVSWTFAMHQFFLDMLRIMGMENPFPDFFRVTDFVARYEQTAGHKLNDVEWYTVFGLLRFAIVSIRTSERGYATGDMERPADHEEGIMNKQLLNAMIAGTNPHWDL